MTLRQGELVTVALEGHNSSSNTYLIARKLEGECLLAHPLFPESYILKPDQELNLVLAQLKSPTERCLDYVSKFSQLLGFDDASDAASLCLYFTVRRKLSGRQKKALANLCGIIASIKCENDLAIGTRIVNENVALLDEFNQTWYDNFEKLFKGVKRVKTHAQRSAMFNIVGFVLAQLEGTQK